MMRHTRILWMFIASAMINCTAHGAEQMAVPTPTTDMSENAPAPVTAIAPQDAHFEHPDTDMPLISINTDTPLDMNWVAALEFSDTALRPVPVTLPFLSDYPFENLEIKLRVLNLKF